MILVFGVFIIQTPSIDASNVTLGITGNSPRGITIDTTGNVYTANSGSNNVTKITPAGVSTTLGTTGTSPSSITIDTTGNVYTANSGSNNVTKITPAGVSTILGVTASTPVGITIDLSGNIYTTNYASNNVTKITPAGVSTILGVTGNSPVGITIDSFDNIYTANSGSNNVTKITPTGISTDHGPTGNSPVFLVLDSYNNIYTSNYGSNSVTRTIVNTTINTNSATSITDNSAILEGNYVDPGTKAVQEKGFEYGIINVSDETVNNSTQSSYATNFVWGSSGSGPSQFGGVTGGARDSSGNIYVVDIGNSKIKKFSSSGVFVTQWGSAGSGAGQFATPQDVAVDFSNNVYVADANNNRIQKFTSSGVYLGQFGSVGSGNGQFSAPVAVTTDSSGFVYVADLVNKRIQKFTNAGVYVTKWGSVGSGDGQFQSLRDLTADSLGNIYATDSTNQRVQKFTNTGVYITKWGTVGSGDGQFNSPYGLSVGPSGTVLVTDLGNNRVQQFSSSGTFISKFGTPGLADVQFNSPIAVVFNGADAYYIIEYSANRIQQVASSVATGVYTIPVGDLSCGSLYSFRGYVSSYGQKSYGSTQTFTTSPCIPPVVTTGAATSVGESSAVLDSTLNSIGSGTLSYRQIEYGTTPSMGTIITDPSTITGTYSSNVNSLSCGTTYYFRAAADNSTTPPATGSTQTFTTSPCIPPVVTTGAATSVGESSAVLDSTLNSIGSGTLSYRQIEYGTTPSMGTIITDPSTITGTYSSNVNSLSCGTTYYFRAAADNSTTPPATGSTQTFTTSPCIPPVVTNPGSTDSNEIKGTRGATGEVPDVQKPFFVPEWAENIQISLSENQAKVVQTISRTFPWVFVGVLGVFAIVNLGQIFLQYRYLIAAKKQKEKQELLSSEKKIFVSLASHYMRTPFTLISLGAESLSSDLNEMNKKALNRQVTNLKNAVEAIVQDVENDQYSQSGLNNISPNHFEVKVPRRTVFIPTAVTLLVTIVVFVAVNMFTSAIISFGRIFQQVVGMLIIGVILYYTANLLSYRKARSLHAKKLLAYEKEIDDSKNTFMSSVTQLLNEPVTEIDKIISRSNIDDKKTVHIGKGLADIKSLLHKFNLASMLNNGLNDQVSEKFDFQELLSEVSKELEENSAKKITIISNNKSGATIYKPRDLIDFVVRSILDNAVKYSADGRSVEVSEKVSKKNINLKARNFGSFLTEQQAEMLFKPLGRLEGVEQFNNSGPGMSLFLSRLIMHYLNGAIRVMPSKDPSTTVELSIPMV
ncbi:hypothetical protein KA068_00330 [Candidatus Saccharibacteria bacterium]|nr:hypothetical protein [Candidatus Saccharibacteria bacterium]